MAYYGTKPIKVADGGTSASSFTSNGVLFGNGTSAPNVASVGDTGTLLVGVTGSTAAFNTAALAGGSTFFFSISTSGTPLTLSVGNTDNTNAASHAALIASCGGPTGGQPRSQTLITSGTNNYGFGIVNATTSPEIDPMTHHKGTTPGSLVDIFFQKSGVLTFPSQTCFLSRLNTQVNNITGAGGTYTLGSGTVLTEIFDQHADITTAGVFTAPITGRYDIRSTIRVLGAASSKVFIISIVTSNRTYQYLLNDTSLSGAQSVTVEAIADMDISDTATVTCVVTGEVSNTDDIGGGTTVQTFICGRLVA